jgi:hypothetical protein
MLVGSNEDSLTDFTGDKSMASLGSYVGIKMENGNTAWVDPNGRIVEVNSDTEVLNTKKAEASEEDSQFENMAHLMFDEQMKEVFYENFDQSDESENQ